MMRWTIEQPGTIVYEDGLRLDVEAVRDFLDQPPGTILVCPDGSRIEFLGRQGNNLVFRRSLDAQGT